MRGGGNRMDVLTDALEAIHLKSMIHGRLELTSGDFVLLPHRQPHVLRDNRRTKAAPASEVFAKCPKSTQGCQPGGIRRYGGGGALTTMVGGCFVFEDGENNPLVASLPPVIHVKGDGGAAVQWLETSLQFVASEMAAGQPGAATVVSRLADILFVHAVRAHLAQSPEGTGGLLRAVVDPQVGGALGLMH